MHDDAASLPNDNKPGKINWRRYVAACSIIGILASAFCCIIYRAKTNSTVADLQKRLTKKLSCRNRPTQGVQLPDGSVALLTMYVF